MDKFTSKPDKASLSQSRIRLNFDVVNGHLSLTLLGEPAVFLHETPLSFSSPDLLPALSYLALQTVPIRLKDLTTLMGVERREEFRESLLAFASATNALEILDNNGLRLHAVVDVLLFEYAVQDGYFEEALSIYQALPEQSFLKNLQPKTQAFQEWCLIEEARLKLLYQDALRGRYETLALSDDIKGAIAVAKQLVCHDPLDEYSHQRIMQLELFQGNLSAALAQYEACKFVLAQYLGVEPLQETQELADIIDALSYDPYFSENNGFTD